jgi:hypothetical protein
VLLPELRLALQGPGRPLEPPSGALLLSLSTMFWMVLKGELVL